MPNQNPSGANQPLNQHPVPGRDIYTLAKDANLLYDLSVASGDTLLIGPPPTGGRRRVKATCVLGSIDGASTDTADVELVYIDKDGNEVILTTFTLTPGSLDQIGDDIILVPDDQGLFIRVTEDSVDAVFVIAFWDDVRNIERTDTVLSAVFQNVHPAAPVGNCRFWPVIGAEGDDQGGKVLNFDDVNHDIEVQLTDGTNTVPVGAFTVLAGISSALEIPCLTVPPGWFVQVRTTTAVSTQAPVAMIPDSLTNQGPARQEQGGAY